MLLCTIKLYLIERSHVYSKNRMPRGLSVDEVLCQVLADSSSEDEYSTCDNDVQLSHKSESAAVQ